VTPDPGTEPTHQPLRRPEIVVIEDDPDTRRLLREGLEDAGFEVRTAVDGPSGLAVLRERPPALALIDQALPGMTGRDVCRQLRRESSFDGVPLVILTALDDTADKITSLESGADDYLRKPFLLEEIVARLYSHIRRSRRERDMNPLTGLPGNLSIDQAITSRLERGERFAVAWVDIDYFKTYNDRYGFVAGDAVIQRTAALLCQVVEDVPRGFAGHIGGDDFVLVVPLRRATQVARTVTERFAEVVLASYLPDDVAQGFVTTPSRKGDVQRFPLMSISVAVVPCAGGRFQHPAEIATVATEIKRHLKLQPGSNWLMDRRSSVSVGARLRSSSASRRRPARRASVA
jgi:diguanylate cyclase (GGDEF)-like protein